MSLTAVSLASCKNKNVPVESVSLDKSEVYMTVNTPVTLNATINPKNATDQSVVWTSSNDIVSVSASGVITATATGESLVTVTTNDGGKTASCQVYVVEEGEGVEFLGPVYKRQSFIDYESNIKEKESKVEEFMDRTQGYSVGCDNPVNLKPQFTVLDYKGMPSSQEHWNHDYVIGVEVKEADTFVTADESLYAIANARNADVQFKPAAVGKTFKVSVMPGGLEDEKAEDPDNTAVYTFNVVEGYNAYTAVDLLYLDSRHGSGRDSEGGESHWGDVDKDENPFMRQWDAFKVAHGLKADYDPSAVIMHQNITITKDDVPANMFYTQADYDAGKVRKGDIDSLKDTMYLYSHNLESKLTLNGNYFQLDFDHFPLVTRDSGEPKTVSDLNSHCALIRSLNGEVEIKNLNVTGNAPKATNADDNVYAGGLMLFKAGHDAKKASLYNVIARQCYITLMSEKTNDAVIFDVNKSRCYDNYNSFFYNWGGYLTVQDSVCRGVGGPIVIQDHSGVDYNPSAPEAHPYEVKEQTDEIVAIEQVIKSLDPSYQTGQLKKYNIQGFYSHTKFIDCELDNLVAGTEAWFVKFGAASVATMLKSMSNPFRNYGLSFAVDENGNPVEVGASEDQKSFMNFIAFNKSGREPGMINDPVCGDVQIINNKTGRGASMNYFQPDYSLIEKAYEIMSALLAEDAAKITELCVRYGVSSAEELQNLAIAMVSNYGTQMKWHECVRGAATANADTQKCPPTFQIGGNFAFTDGNYLLDDLSKVQQGIAPSPVAPTDSFITEAQDYLSMYFLNMGLVLGLVHD